MGGVVVVVRAFLLLVLLDLPQLGAQLTDPVEVKALQDIRRTLRDPLRNLLNWNRGDPCVSNWTGVFCFNTTENDGNLHISELHLLNMNLTGTLSPELGRLSYLKILDFMWNNISGSIPKEIGNIKSLELLILNGNLLTGSLPEELGFLPNLNRIQVDQNNISGPLPKSFANLNKTKHFHMNNNSISGQIPPELSRLPSLVHFLLDNNNLSGYLPPEFSDLPELLILQLDNNHFDGTIPASYGNMSKLLKMSLRNCSLQGAVPDLSRIPELGYLDLSWNQLNGSIPSDKLSDNITTIDLSYNNLNGRIPANYSNLPSLQRLSLENNSLSGDIPSTIWQNWTSNGNKSLLVDLQNNELLNISGSVNPPANVSIRLQGNPVCEIANQLNIVQFCRFQAEGENVPESPITPAKCFSQSCPEDYEYVEKSPVPCFCAAPLRVRYRLKSPGFSDFTPYKNEFEVYLTSGLEMELYQLSIASSIWVKGPRLRMELKLFPKFNNRSNIFNKSEIRRIRSMFTGWTIPDSEIFGPYELLKFTLLGPYEEDVLLDRPKSGISKGAVAGIVVGAVTIAILLSAVVSILIMRRSAQKRRTVSRKRQSSRLLLKIDGVKDFTFGEMALATNSFSNSTQIGQGGYGKVYKGILADGTIVAVKRALEGSLQGEKEFLTEIELLSRVHHRNLVSLIGYCDEEGEQMLVYEFMPNGTLRDHLSVRSKEAVGFPMRLRIALGSAKGILYLHTEANPPIFHRDIKASNILLDSKFTAKVADFGLSRLAPVPDIEGTVPGHISTVVKGTPGYLDPEYFLTHKLTDKSDVYSLGVVFLELLTGMQPISHGKNIVREVNLSYQSGMIFSVIDERMGSYPSECVEKFVTLALNCCQDDTDARPSMADVVRELENIWLMMPESEIGASDSVDMVAKKVSHASSTSVTKNPYVSSDVSGSDLVSGVLPTIAPR
ncbi:Receptor-like protein kinase feronia [Thalictrum thalictroides]|uniref:non-specific serine/threonine protein kinase n=1 Tax=Thalictrum thalictroides TaxID=46969 RepID=A0A7J6WLU0_THATH|nr:Receptor-like protein kinase feronia [Thalictrum thalictroides]